MKRAPLASPWTFFAAVFAWTWVFWLADIVLGLGADGGPGRVLALLGLLGPMIGGIAFTYLTRDAAGRRDYWLRLIDFTRIGGKGWAAIVVLTPFLMALAALIDILTGGSPMPFEKNAAPFVAAPGALVPFAISILLIGPLPEELGWRGYVLDRLQERWNGLTASLVLGAIWAVWHLPLFFIPGTYQYEQGAWSLWFWTFMVGIVPLAVVMGWLFNATRRSTLAVVLFHFMVVFVDDFLNASAGTNLWSTVLWIGAAIAVVWAAPQEMLAKPAAPGSARPTA